MKKKVIGLSTLLLVLLLGLSSTSYAKTLTENDIRNFCENAYKSKINDTIPTEVKQYIANADFSTWANYTSQYEGQWVISYNDRDIIFMCFNASDTNLNTYCMYKASNRIQVNTSFLTYITRQRFSFNTGGFINNADVYDQSNFVYTDGLVTNNGRRNGTVIYQAGTYKPNDSIFEGDYHNTLFTYVYNPNLQNATVEDIPYNNGQMKAISYNDIYYDNDYLCIFGDYDQLDHVFMSCLKYNNYVGGWVTYKEIEPYSYFDIEDNQIRLYFNGNFIANTIIYLGFIPKTR